jgi:hypothetical protein
MFVAGQDPLLSLLLERFDRPESILVFELHLEKYEV